MTEWSVIVTKKCYFYGISTPLPFMPSDGNDDLLPLEYGNTPPAALGTSAAFNFKQN